MDLGLRQISYKPINYIGIQSPNQLLVMIRIDPPD